MDDAFAAGDRFLLNQTTGPGPAYGAVAGPLSGFRASLTADRLWTWETVVVEATRLLTDVRDKPYRHVVVDEAQDLAPWQWRLLRAAVPFGPDDLFLAGDTHQRIYSHRVSLRGVGIDVAGRSTRLSVNYRTTAEILGNRGRCAHS